MATSTTKVPAGGTPPGPPGEPSARGTARRRGALLHRLDIKGAPYAFVAPFFVVFAAFSFYPSSTPRGSPCTTWNWPPST